MQNVILPHVLLCLCHCSLHQSVYDTQGLVILSLLPSVEQGAYVALGFNGSGKLAFHLGDQIPRLCACHNSNTRVDLYKLLWVALIFCNF